MRITATIAALAALGLATPLLAATAAEIDTNGDGVLTIDEVLAVYPDLTSETFVAMDLNADGALDGDEVAAAQEAGLMPASEG